jgi:1,2-diacylglycerol 3-beta-galactosyltransferase
MWDWMGACDCIVTKAGPGTIAEALARALPILLFDYIPGQEEGNVSYVVRHGIGAYIDKPQQIADAVVAWFGHDRELLDHMTEQTHRLARPRASYEIVEAIASMVEANSITSFESSQLLTVGSWRR